MKYIQEYRDPELLEQYLDEIKKTVTRPWTIMEVCGGQTHSLVKNGILQILPEEVQMIHGPGCPVCVTPMYMIDKAVHLSMQDNVILCSFGDMLRVPGSQMSLLEAKSKGGNIKILYSPLEAVTLAMANPDKEVVFFAVGFETTAPANALSIIHAQKLGVENYSILASHVLVPPAISAVMEDEVTSIQGFLAAGHVCTIMGISEYYPLTEKYNVPIVVTGFEPVDLMQGILMTVKQLEEGRTVLENQYSRVVKKEGSPDAIDTIMKVFEIRNQEWRGIGEIPDSGYKIRKEYEQYDANVKFNINIDKAEESKECIAGDILKGIKKPKECPHFGKKCNPQNPLGAPMVSSEGACAAYYHFAVEEV